MSVTIKRGKVVVRLRNRQCTLDADTATKTGVKLIDAAKKAAKQAKAFQEA